MAIWTGSVIDPAALSAVLMRDNRAEIQQELSDLFAAITGVTDPALHAAVTSAIQNLRLSLSQLPQQAPTSPSPAAPTGAAPARNQTPSVTPPPTPPSAPNTGPYPVAPPIPLPPPPQAPQPAPTTPWMNSPFHTPQPNPGTPAAPTPWINSPYHNPPAGAPGTMPWATPAPNAPPGPATQAFQNSLNAWSAHKARFGGEIELMIKSVQRMGEGYKEIGEGSMKALKSDRLEGQISGAGDALQGMGKAAGPAGGFVFEWAGKFVTAIGDSIGALRGWGDALYKANMQFAEFSAAMGDVQVAQQNRDIELNQRRGDRRAEVADAQAEQRHRTNVQFARLEDAWANKSGNWNVTAGKWGEEIARAVADALGIEKDEPDVGPGNTMTEMFADILKADSPQTYGQPPRFRGP